MKLSEYLKEQLSKRGAQAKFARATGISDGTASKWARGEMDRAPNFENCMWIASYFHKPPQEVFEMAGRREYVMLFEKLFPEYREPKPAVASSPYREENKEWHRLLEETLNAPNAEFWIQGIQANLISMHGSATSGKPSSAPLLEKKQPPRAEPGRSKLKIRESH